MSNREKKRTYEYDDYYPYVEKTHLTVEQVETENMPEDEEFVPHLPFGFQNEQWLKFKNMIQHGDEIRRYDTMRLNPRGPGSAGYCLMRKSKIITLIATVRSCS